MGQPSGEHVVIATTRPETIPADTAVAVNPEDERYTEPGGAAGVGANGGPTGDSDRG